MAGIAGIGRQNGLADTNDMEQVQRMLDRMGHRGPAGRALLVTDSGTLGAVWPTIQAGTGVVLQARNVVRDRRGHGPLARAAAGVNGLTLTRGPFGVAPLYYGRTDDGALCFASEVKALREVARRVRALPPGHHLVDGREEAYFQLEPRQPLDYPPDALARELRRRLAAAVERRIGDGNVGAWLSGGLDSSTMVALARPHVGQLHTFAAGTEGAPDLEHARVVAGFLQTTHHELVVGLDDMLAVLPEVIYHLESFDALLVRSSVTNYLVARLAAEYVPAVFSGEGGDELFAGYDYLKVLDPARLPDELVDITRRLHNTALQRVDRCAAAHGTVAHIAFLDPAVASLALRIPVSLKLRDGVEKWILRQAMDGALPEQVLHRTKAKFWEGAGVGEQLARVAEERISDAEFRQERWLPDGQVINTKEELMYYRIFREQLGDFDDLEWMGRTKNPPRVRLDA